MASTQVYTHETMGVKDTGTYVNNGCLFVCLFVCYVYYSVQYIA